MEAHTLPGNQLLAGPVLLDHRAVWAEGGRRLLIRSLDVHGRTRTLFSTSKARGAPKGAVWPFWVWSIAAGDGRIAFVEGVIPCASAPPRGSRCSPRTAAVPADSITVFAGRPGAIRPITTLMHPGRHCEQGQAEPGEVAITDAGIVDYETSVFSCRPGFSRLALRSFSGRLKRVLARKLPVVTDFAAAGNAAALIRKPHVKAPDELKIVRLDTGQTLLHLRRRCVPGIDAVALDSSGRFALTTSTGNNTSSCPHRAGNTVKIGRVGDAHLQAVAKDAFVGIPTTSIAAADGYVAYWHQTGASRTDAQLMLTAPGSTPTPLRRMKFGPLAFDGRVVATAHEDTVQLAALQKS